MSHIIAVAGPIGSGKSTLTRNIALTLGDTSTLFYDSYEQASRQSPAAMIQWMRTGADFNTFDLSELAHDLTKLKNGIPVRDPLSGETIVSAKRIVFEMPLGREHRATEPFIDLLVWIDIPLDVALARKMREYVANFRAEGMGIEALDWLREYLDSYPVMIHPLLELQIERVRPRADIRIDGQADPLTQARRASEAILGRLKNSRNSHS